MLRYAALISVLLTAALPAAAQAPKVFRYSPSSDLNNLDPHTTQTTTTGQLGMMVFDTLFSFDESLVPHPQMVDTYSVSADGLTYSFKLRPGLKFHDGQPVTGGDVVASINRWMTRDVLGQQMKAALAEFRAEGADGFVMLFKKRFPFVEVALASTMANQAVIMRKQDAETDPFKPLTTAIGSGPYRFLREQWQPGNGAVWERNRDYVPRKEKPNGMAGGKVANFDRIEMRFIPDANTRATALINGEIDLIDQVPADVMPILKKNSKVEVQILNKAGAQTFIRPNHLNPPFNNLKARQALALLVKQSDYMLAGYGTPDLWLENCMSYFICNSPNDTTAGSDPYKKQDLAQARKLLAESGYKGEPIVILATRELPGQGALADVTAANLREIGANVDLQIMDFAGMLARRNRKEPASQGGWNLFHIAVSGSIMYSPLTNFVIDSRCDQKNYVGWACDEEVERLRRDYADAPDEATRKVKLEELSRALWASLPIIPTGQYFTPFAWRKEITGVLKGPQLVFWNIDRK